MLKQRFDSRRCDGVAPIRRRSRRGGGAAARVHGIVLMALVIASGGSAIRTHSVSAQPRSLDLLLEHGGRLSAAVADGPWVYIGQLSRVHALELEDGRGLLRASSAAGGDPIKTVAAREGLIVTGGLTLRTLRHEGDSITEIGSLRLRTQAVEVGLLGGRVWLRDSERRLFIVTLDADDRPVRFDPWAPELPSPDWSAMISEVAPIPGRETALVYALWSEPNPAGGLPLEEGARLMEVDFAPSPPRVLSQVVAPMFEGLVALVTDGRQVLLIPRFGGNPATAYLAELDAQGLHEMSEMRWGGTGTWDAVIQGGGLWRIDLEGLLHFHETPADVSFTTHHRLENMPLQLLALRDLPAALTADGLWLLDRDAAPRQVPVLDTSTFQDLALTRLGAWLLQEDGRVMFFDGEKDAPGPIVPPGAALEGVHDIHGHDDRLIVIRDEHIEFYHDLGGGRLRLTARGPEVLPLDPPATLVAADADTLLYYSERQHWLHPLRPGEAEPVQLLGLDGLALDAAFAEDLLYVWYAGNGPPARGLRTYSRGPEGLSPRSLLGVPASFANRISLQPDSALVGNGVQLSYLDLGDPDQLFERDVLDLPEAVVGSARGGDTGWAIWSGGGRGGLTAVDLRHPDRLADLGQAALAPLTQLAQMVADGRSAWLLDRGALRRFALSGQSPEPTMPPTSPTPSATREPTRPSPATPTEAPRTPTASPPPPPTHTPVATVPATVPSPTHRLWLPWGRVFR